MQFAVRFDTFGTGWVQSLRNLGHFLKTWNAEFIPIFHKKSSVPFWSVTFRSALERTYPRYQTFRESLVPRVEQT